MFQPNKVIFKLIVFVFSSVLMLPAWGDTDCSQEAVTGIAANECNALITLYKQTNGTQWINQTNWNTDTPVVDWFGLELNDNHVLQINLYENQLEGELPDIWQQFPVLDVLDISTNRLSGTLPESLWQLTALTQLYLSNNRFEGTLSPKIQQLQKILLISIGFNLLEGPIPAEIGLLAKLRRLTLNHNYFNGTIPAELGQLNELIYLSIDNNKLVGQIPPELGNMSNLEFFLVFSNELTGVLPPELGKLKKLDFLDVDENQIGGTIPPEFGNLESITRLDLDTNHLTGSIPPELGKLVKLTDLYMRHNQLSGSIPPELGNLVNLQKFFIEENKLSGEIPAELGQLEKLRWLRLQGNVLTGNIPDELIKLPNLERLFVQKNKLSGIIPESLLEAPNLTRFDLRFNQFQTDKPAVLAWINEICHKDCLTSQVISPTELAVSNIKDNSALITWKPTPYTLNDGFYRIRYRSSTADTYVNAGSTESMRDKDFLLENLEAATSYDVTIEIVAPPHDSQQTVLSSLSQPLALKTTGTSANSSKQTGCFSIENNFSSVQNQQSNRLIAYIEEDVGNISINILREAGLNNKVIVDYVVLGLDAYAPADYTMKNTEGTLVFEDQQATQKIQINIINDLVSESDEFFRIRLLNPRLVPADISEENAGETVNAQNVDIPPPTLCQDNLFIAIKKSDPLTFFTNQWILVQTGKSVLVVLDGGDGERFISQMPDSEIMEVKPYDGGNVIELTALSPGATTLTVSDSRAILAQELLIEIYVGMPNSTALTPENIAFKQTYTAADKNAVNLVRPFKVPESDDWLEAKSLFFLINIDDTFLQVNQREVCDENSQCQQEYFFNAFNASNPFVTKRDPSWIMDLGPELKNVNGFDLTNMDFSDQGLALSNTEINIFQGFAHNPEDFLNSNIDELLSQLIWSWYTITIE